MQNSITQLFSIEKPIVQGGMVWCSGWRLASSVSEAGGLGLLGAGSMYPDVLKEHIVKAKRATRKPFGVNVPLLYPDIEEVMNIIAENDVKVVFTSAGNPALWTSWLKERGITVVHVVSSTKFAKKAENAGVDAIVAEGFEAGGHNGREETTTLCLIPEVVKGVNVPVIAAGGIGSGKTMLAAFALGAKGVQIGSKFAASVESSAHVNFKKKIIEASEGDTQLILKSLVPVRLIKNQLYERIKNAEIAGAGKEELAGILGKGKARLGIFEGDINEGELEIGQICSTINKIEHASDILNSIWVEFRKELEKLRALNI